MINNLQSRKAAFVLAEVVACIGFMCCIPVRASAAISFFTNRVAWQAAAGPSTFTEDFSSFLTDTQFRTVAVAINGGTIQQEGVNAVGAFRNQVDVSPLEFSPNSGSASASLYANFPESPNPGAQVRMSFASLTSAFGFDSWDAANGEIALLEVFSGATLLGSQALTNGSGDFLGFVLSGGDTATSVRFRSSTLNAGQGGEGFYIDNLAGVAASSAVPEPTSFVMLSLGGLGLLARAVGRRRKKS